jgi:hypothetical protein
MVPKSEVPGYGGRAVDVGAVVGSCKVILVYLLVVAVVGGVRCRGVEVRGGMVSGAEDDGRPGSPPRWLCSVVPLLTVIVGRLRAG